MIDEFVRDQIQRAAPPIRSSALRAQAYAFFAMEDANPKCKLSFKASEDWLSGVLDRHFSKEEQCSLINRNIRRRYHKSRLPKVEVEQTCAYQDLDPDNVVQRGNGNDDDYNNCDNHAYNTPASNNTIIHRGPKDIMPPEEIAVPEHRSPASVVSDVCYRVDGNCPPFDTSIGCNNSPLKRVWRLLPHPAMLEQKVGAPHLKSVVEEEEFVLNGLLPGSLVT